MAINQDADFGSVSMEKENQESDGKLGGLWVKLKIPKEEKELQSHTNNGDIENKKKRVCHICQKTFSSGKALGGHMRIHVQPPNKKLDANSSKKQLDFINTTCYTCGKDFKSMKSLSGHMRSHPERVWRGIRPPSSSDDDDRIRVSVSGDKADSRVLDLTQSLPTRWPVTAKRGRKGTAVGSYSSSSSENDQFWKAVYYLMMLAREEKECVEVVETNIEGATSDVVNGESDDDDDERDHSKKKRKKMKELCDLQSSEIASATPMPAKYRQDTSSGHNISAISGVLEGDEVIQKVFEIDLNEAPQSE